MTLKTLNDFELLGVFIMCIVCKFSDTFNTMVQGDALTIQIASPDIRSAIELLRVLADTIENDYVSMEGKCVMALSEKSAAYIEYDHISKQQLDQWRIEINEYEYGDKTKKTCRYGSFKSGNTSSH